MANYNEPQPAPVNVSDVYVWDLVFCDMQDRDGFGVNKYGCRLVVENGRDPLVDAYQEALDLVVYLRQEIYKRYGK